MKTREEIAQMVSDLKKGYVEDFGVEMSAPLLLELLKQNRERILKMFIDSRVSMFDGRDTLQAIELLEKKVVDGKTEGPGAEDHVKGSGKPRGRPRASDVEQEAQA